MSGAPTVLTAGLAFDPDAHAYALDGVPVYGVTTILKLAGYVSSEWFDDFARDRGSAVHLAAHYDDLGDLDVARMDPRLEPYLDAWRLFRRETGYAPAVLNGDGLVASEFCVASRTYGFATTVDRVLERAEARGKPLRVLAEIKTGDPGDGAALQTAGQSLALEENGIFCARRMSVRLRPDGRYTVATYTEHTRDRNDFLAGLLVVRRRFGAPQASGKVATP